MTPRPGRREEWRCSAHEPLIERVAAIDERTKAILDILERRARREDEIERRQREDGGRGQLLSGTLSGTARTLTLMLAAGAVTVGAAAAIAAIVRLIGG